jgi:hypothetical protein
MQTGFAALPATGNQDVVATGKHAGMPYQVTYPDAGESATQLWEILRNWCIDVDLALSAQLVHCDGC